MFLITFSKAGQEDIVLTEDDLFDFQYEASCYSGETFELGGVNAKTLYLLIDNNTQRFSRGTFANCRVKLEIDGKFFGYYNTELPKRRNGVIELTAYDDMVKLDTEFPTDYTFPQTLWAVYAQCAFEAGLASEVSFDNVILNGVWDNGIISADYTQFIYANSCRNLVAGMAGLRISTTTTSSRLTSFPRQSPGNTVPATLWSLITAMKLSYSQR